MEKFHIKIPLILPDVPDEKDHCIERLIDTLHGEKGIDKIHVADNKNNGVPELCFHYNPDIISIARITALAKQTGAALTAKIGHKLFEVTGIRHTRHAKQIETILQKQKGILEASVTETGLIRVESDTGQINQDTILEILSQQKLTIKTTDDHVHKEEHDHEHGGIFGEKTELIFSIVGGVLLGI